MKHLRPSIILVLLLLLSISVAAFDQGENFSPVNRERIILDEKEAPDNTPEKQALADPPYWEGSLRVYVVEHLSSLGWKDLNGKVYDFPFLAYAINLGSLVINDASWDTTVTWDGYDFGYNNLQENNIAVQAVLFSQADGYPEAAAMAESGLLGSNVMGPGTHTVFVEEGTATW